MSLLVTVVDINLAQKPDMSTVLHGCLFSQCDRLGCLCRGTETFWDSVEIITLSLQKSSRNQKVMKLLNLGTPELILKEGLYSIGH